MKPPSRRRRAGDATKKPPRRRARRLGPLRRRRSRAPPLEPVDGQATRRPRARAARRRGPRPSAMRRSWRLRPSDKTNRSRRSPSRDTSHGRVFWVVVAPERCCGDLDAVRQPSHVTSSTSRANSTTYVFATLLFGWSSVGAFAVVRQQHEALGIGVEASHREDATACRKVFLQRGVEISATAGRWRPWCK